METSAIKQDANGTLLTVERTDGQIFKLIGKAIGMIGAIGKDKTNVQQGFKYRGIDQVYNAMNPVMAELGIFFCPEVLDQKREERVTKNGAVLTYTLLTMKFTAYAPDGSNVSMTVVGEGMDSGDKSSNKAMSVAMKYAMFQLFCIPTEEMKDPDADVYTDILPKGQKPQQKPQDGQKGGSVTTADRLPDGKAEAPKPATEGPSPEPRKGESAGAFISRRIAEMKLQFDDLGFDFMGVRSTLIRSGLAKDTPSATMSMDEAKQLMAQVQKFYEDKRAEKAAS